MKFPNNLEQIKKNLYAILRSERSKSWKFFMQKKENKIVKNRDNCTTWQTYRVIQCKKLEEKK